MSINHNSLSLGSVRISSFAEKLFTALDPRLAPRSLVIVLCRGADGSDIFIDETPMLPTDSREDLARSLSGMNGGEPFTDPLFEFEIISFLRDFFDRLDDASRRVSFFSAKVADENHFIVVVLQFDLAQYTQHNRLSSGYRGRVHSYLSLLDATAERFLVDAERYVVNILKEGGLGMEDGDNEAEVIRWAGKALMLSVGMKTAGSSVQQPGPLDTGRVSTLFSDINMISSLFYEGRQCKGGILIAPSGHENVEELYHLGAPVPLTAHRGVRKLLELCFKDHFLLATDGHIRGIGRLVGECTPDREDLFQILFKKHYRWVLLHGSKELMAVTYGMPKMTDRPCDKAEVTELLEREFSGIGRRNAEDIIELIYYATFQKHGTILVILQDVRSELARLSSQAVVFDPFELTTDNLLQFSNIDGAIIIDTERRCHAIGVILDGTASERGSSSRGARYNSAVRYIDSLDVPSMAVVVSEDGMVDIVT